MKKEKKKEPEAPQVLWHEENRTLTLEGEPVLDYALSWPELADAGRGGRRISRYYARLAQSWRLRWQREVYWKACIQLADRRAAARPLRSHQLAHSSAPPKQTGKMPSEKFRVRTMRKTPLARMRTAQTITRREGHLWMREKWIRLRDRSSSGV